MMRLLAIAALVVAGSGCSSNPVNAGGAKAEIVLGHSSVRLEGWFSATGEWMVNPEKGDFESYNPADKPLNERCVSVVNDTGSERDEFVGLDGKRVVMTGFVMGYRDIPIGSTDVDQMMQRRYYKDELVFDSCRRLVVFIANSIQSL